VKAKLRTGSYVWIECEVKPGPFSDERLVRAQSSMGSDEWVGFASTAALRESVSVGFTAIKALVIGIQKDSFQAQPLGSSLTRTLFTEKVSKATLVA
jgi:hypothetical protein